jgi:hypothetical protein
MQGAAIKKIIIPMFLNCSTYFGRHTAHHQELKNCNCSLWFYIRFLLPAAAMARQPKTCVKPEAAITVFELLMMSSVSPETCWAFKKHWIINSTTRLYLVDSLYEIYITMHGSMNIIYIYIYMYMCVCVCVCVCLCVCVFVCSLLPTSQNPCQIP